jgi:hypothetical protein
MCKEAGILGNFSNHSIRATAVTRMYESGLTEKMIMKRSGHRSTDGVRAYQREDTYRQVEVSNALACSNSFVVHSAQKLSDSSNDTTLRNDSINISEEDSVLVNACIDYERSQSHIDIGGILQGGTVQTVNINIMNNK